MINIWTLSKSHNCLYVDEKICRMSIKYLTGDKSYNYFIKEDIMYINIYLQLPQVPCCPYFELL